MNQSLGLKSKMILIVEDDEILRECLVEYFSMNGAVAIGVENGDLAWKLIQKQKFDAVICDMKMATGDGSILLGQIRDLNPPRPLTFICSGYHDLSDFEIQSLGVQAVFTKPFDSIKLISQVCQALLAKAA
jgi:CheY-like chemotaxis protein